MRFLIATGIFPPEIGGPATAIKKLVDGLLAAGHEVKAVTYGDPRQEKFVHNVSRDGGALSRYLRMARAIRENLVEGTVLLSTDVFSVGIPARLALIGKKNAFLLRLGGEWWWEDSVEKGRTDLPMRKFWLTPRMSLRDGLAKMNYRWILRRTEKIAVTSEMLGEVLKKICPEISSKISVATNTAPGKVERKETAEPHKPLRLAYVGRFARVKNVPFLASLLKRLIVRGEAVECVFAGDGPTLAESKKILENVPGMSFLGRTTKEKTLELLRDADVLVLPSLTDICPNIVLEALSVGTPAVITSENGLPKGMGGTIELSPTDQDAWIQALASLRDSEKYQRLKSGIKLPGEVPLKLMDFVTSL